MSLMSLKGGPADLLIGDGLHAMILRVLLFLYFCRCAYTIRLHAIEEYGLVIHEFDPWFNYRATEYLAQHGYEKFFKWYDYMSWYPLGRPVGTTIYPGMQLTSVAIWNVLNGLGIEISLNDVCCYVPAWFGVLATIFLTMLTYECSGSANGAVAAAGIMAVVPAHIMRSVGGGYDNESVAMTAMCCTFYFWCRSLRGDASWPIGIVAGIAYIYMAAAWGGYIFVVNMIGVHAIGLVFLGRYSNKLHHAYTLFYIIGTIGAMQVPVIGWTPLKSLEQLGALGVFCVLQVLYYCDIQRVKGDLDADAVMALRIRAFGIAGGIGFALVACIWPTGYFGPLSSRIRGLFVQHTRTGNPLVDSVAEHQPASAQAYFQYLHNVCYIGPVGFVACLYKKTDAKFFLIMYACVAYYFSAKMVRLVLLLGPIGSALGGLALANGCEWMLDQLADVVPGFADGVFEEEDEPAVVSPKKSKRGSKRGGRGGGDGGDINGLYKEICTSCRSSYDSEFGIHLRKIGALIMAALYIFWIPDFVSYSQEMAVGMSQPSIMFKGTLRNGQSIMVDDYREAYWWLRDNTAEDARVMAWWDYGYQISGIANRTTIADGNTWNHEHIATLGRCLTSPEKQAHRIVRHLADYVLIWTGGGGDDLAKSPHMARIGTSVYKDICPGDPTCSAFGFVDHQSMTPTPMMAESLLYKLHGHNQSPGVTVDPQRFREVFTSKYNKVRIFKVLKVSKESKKWVANPANRDCDAPGSWYCTGNYPPALQDLINQRKNFKQLEDFNVERDEDDEEHYKEYMRRMAGGEGEAEEGYKEVKAADAAKAKTRKERKEAERAAKTSESVNLPADADEAGDYDPTEDAETGAESKYEPPTGQEAPMEHSREWADTPITTRMWSLIHGGKTEELFEWVQSDPSVVHVRAADGRGPLWWAYEYEQTAIQQLLVAAGVDPAEEDSDGNVASTMAP